MARYRVSLTQNGQHNFAYNRRINFNSSDKRGHEFSGLTSQQIHAISTGSHAGTSRRELREDR